MPESSGTCFNGTLYTAYVADAQPNVSPAPVLQTEKVDAKCVTWQEANMKMELANLIFDDMIEDTAIAYYEAHNMPVPVTV